MTVPFVVVAAFALAHFTGSGGPAAPRSTGPPPALSFPAPPQAGAQSAACAKMLAGLPVTLRGLTPRVVHTRPDTPFVVAWGDPAVVLRCGVARPAALKPGSGAQFILGGNPAGPYYDVQRSGDANVWTTVDRAAYISVTVPTQYAADPLPTLSRVIAKALPPVCRPQNDQGTVPNRQLCTRR